MSKDFKGSILVTGGAGYIGSHTCKKLFEAGYSPVVIDNLIYGHKEFVKWGPLYQGEISDSDLLNKVINTHQIQSAIHFAAFAYVGESVSNPEKYYKNNLENGLLFLNTLIKNKVNKLVFSSSCATYGEISTNPINEKTQTNPINPYGKSKRMFEQILQDYQIAFNLSSVALRYFNAAGADKELEIGEDHQPETHLIPLAIKAAYDPDYTLTVFGNDYKTNDGTCIRDFVHVSDLANAHTLAIQKIENTSSDFRIYNLGTGKGTSVKEIINTVEKITNKKVKIKFGERRAGDPDKLIASNEQAKLELGWDLNNSSIENIIETACRFYQKRFLKN